MGSFGLNIGLRALLTAQSALETVGHNISNANTEGYSRQDLHITAARPLRLRGLELGAGVVGDMVLRTEDMLLTRRIVAQASLVKKLGSMSTNMGGVEALLGEPGGLGLGGLLDGFFASVSDLSTNPEDAAFRSGVTQSAVDLSFQFHQLADELGQLQAEAADRVEFFTNEVNVRAQQIVELNREITKVEGGGGAANDLRDKRDLALRKLAEQIDITFHETKSGGVQVLIAGQMLVGETTVNELGVEVDDDGQVQLMLAGGTRPVTPSAGEIGGLLAFARDFVPGFKAEVDELARSLILATNRAHSTGIPQGGGFQHLAGIHAIQDTDLDGERLDELLADAGLPFAVKDGELYVHVEDQATGELVTRSIRVEAKRTTVGDLLTALNGIDQLTAGLDTFGRMRISAGSGFRFDFSRRLNPAPDVGATLGSGRASRGSTQQGPFDLIAGSTLDLTGPVSSFSVSLDPLDFVDMSEATAAEVALALNASADMTTNQLRAVAVGDQLFLQTLGAGAGQTFTIDGGSAAAELGFAPATVVVGHDTAVGVELHGSYGGDSNQVFVFRPLSDGQIGTTPGLQIAVETADGLPVTILEVGAGYPPGTPISVVDGISASFTFGEVSATDNDAFLVNALADSDSSDVLVALGLNVLFEGTDAETLALRGDIEADPALLAASASGAAGDNGTLLDLMALATEDIEGLNGSFGDYYGAVVSDIGFEISATQNSLQVEQFLSDALDQRRQEFAGVNIDEELVDMIQFEQAFGAASQFIQVINQLHDEVLSLL